MNTMTDPINGGALVFAALLIWVALACATASIWHWIDERKFRLTEYRVAVSFFAAPCGAVILGTFIAAMIWLWRAL